MKTHQRFIRVRRKTPPFLGLRQGHGQAGDIRRCRQANLFLKYVCSLFDHWIRWRLSPAIVEDVKWIASSR